MPKRSAENKIMKYKKKIRKLERQRIRVLNESSSDSEGHEHLQNQDLGSVSPVPDEFTECMQDNPEIPTIGDMVEIPVASTTNIPENPAVSLEPTPEVATTSVDIPPLDPDLLLALGESTDDSPEFGEKIVDNLANLWLPLLKKGIPKEVKEKLLKEYIIPDNCRLLQSPKLNAEISAAIPDMVRNRDKNLSLQQQQLGCGITAVNRAMDMLLKGDDKINAMKHLSNSCRIMSDLHAMFTNNRIKCITPSLDKTFLHVIQDTERDDTIFGNNLSEKIKAAKAIERQGLQIKKISNPKPSTSVQQPRSHPTYSGNWSAPPRYPLNRGGRGAQQRRTTTFRRPFTAPSTSKASGQHKPRAPPTQ